MIYIKLLVAIGLLALWWVPLYDVGGGARSGLVLSLEHWWLWAAPVAAIAFVWAVRTGRYRLQLGAIVALALFADVVLTFLDGDRFVPVPSLWLGIVLLFALALTFDEGLKECLPEGIERLIPTLAFGLALAALAPVYFALTSEKKEHNELYLKVTRLLEPATPSSAPPTVATGSPAVPAQLIDPALESGAAAPKADEARVALGEPQLCELVPLTVKGWTVHAPGATLLQHLDWLPASRQVAVTTEGGELYLSRDDGESWVHGRCGSLFAFRAVQFLDTRTGWAIGWFGKPFHGVPAIAQTRDGGATWRARAIPNCRSSKLKVHFWNGRHGIVTGSQDVFITSDGGETWRRSMPTRNGDVTEVGFGSNRSAWVYDHYLNSVHHTDDGGASWQHVAGLTDLLAGNKSQYPALWDIRFSDPRFVLVVDRHQRLYGSRDQGETWVRLQPVPGTDRREVTAVQVRGAKSALVQVTGGQGGLYATEDAGQSWKRISGSPTHGSVDGLLLSDARGFRFGRGGVVERTTNGGRSWHPVGPFHTYSLAAIRFASANDGWAIGESGKVLHTADGGRHWVWRQAPTRDTLVAGGFTDARTGWVLSEHGAILYTRDAGANWTEQRSGKPEQQWRDLYMLDAEHGWAVGDQGRVLCTVDGGQQWQMRASFFDESLRAVFFVDREHGWAVGERGLILYTRDGGLTWRDQPLPTGKTLSSVHFRDRLNGWVVGEDQRAYRTSDGGVHWQPVALPAEPPFHAIRFFGDRHGWLVGRAGWYRTANGGETWQPLAAPDGAHPNAWEVPAMAWFASAETAWAVDMRWRIWRYSPAAAD